MADLAPFRGIQFDKTRVNLAKVLAPPYDVIDDAERARLAADPHNAVHLIKPIAPDGGDRYQAAAATLASWLAEGVLRRDPSRAVYRYHQTFSTPELGDRVVTRRGFVAAVRLEPFSARVILPHERTLAAPREDRAKLLTATRTQLSPVFGLYPDPAGEVERLFRPWDRAAPDLTAVTADGVTHTMWRCADAELVGGLRRAFSPKKIYLADGHHRYDTMLAYRDALLAKGDPGMYSAANYGLMFLCATDDPGLVVLPTHRLVHGLAELNRDQLLTRANEFFIVEKLPGAARDGAAVRAAIASTPTHQPAFAAVFPGDPDAWRLTLDPHVHPAAVGIAGHAAVARMDVSLLHALVLERILGITPAAQEAQTNLRYVKDTGQALAEVADGKAQVGFVMGAARLPEIKHLADLGEAMPQKSTYFHPKLATGLVMNLIDRDEDLQ